MPDVYILTRNGSQFEGVFKDYDSTVKHMRLLFKRLSNIERSIAQMGSFVIQRTKLGDPVGHGYFEHWSRKKAGSLGCRSKGDATYSYWVPEKMNSVKGFKPSDFEICLEKVAKQCGGMISGGGCGMGSNCYDHTVEIPYYYAVKFEKLLTANKIKFKQESLNGGYEN
jgi:hypothetical protein